jgi:hypothetical protein
MLRHMSFDGTSLFTFTVLLVRLLSTDTHVWLVTNSLSVQAVSEEGGGCGCPCTGTLQPAVAGLPGERHRCVTGVAGDCCSEARRSPRTCSRRSVYLSRSLPPFPSLCVSLSLWPPPSLSLSLCVCVCVCVCVSVGVCGCCACVPFKDTPQPYTVALCTEEVLGQSNEGGSMGITLLLCGSQLTVCLIEGLGTGCGIKQLTSGLCIGRVKSLAIKT